ncbi:MAG: FAD-binding oxidoreductase [Paracoccaceae bacterium]
MAKALKIVVVGAGIVGVSTAIWLRRAHHDVVLIDKDEPGMAASYGNAGLLAQWAVVPVTTPGLLKTAPKYLFDPNSPLFMRWSYLPKIAPWLFQFMRHANDADARRIAEALVPIVGDSMQQHKSLVQGTDVENRLKESNFSFVYEDRKAFEKDAYGWALRRECGLVPELIEGRAVQEEEPILGPSINLMAVLKGHGHILNPGHYVSELAQFFQNMGGQFVRAEVTDFDLAGDEIQAVDTTKGRFVCSKAVITSGIWSKPLMQKLALNVPLETERGYHVLFKNPSQQPRNPMMMASGKFGVTPMGNSLRCAGTVELGGIDAGPSRAPIKLLRKKAAQAFPNLTYSDTEEWMGFRPSTTDSLPLIGELRSTGIFTGFGHQHIGLTAGPKTGRIVADLIDGTHPNIDLSAYDPMRFS